MVLYVPAGKVPLRNYGLLVPIPPDRVGPILEDLRKEADLAAREAEWLIGPDGSAIIEEDVLRVNTSRYAEQLYRGDVEAAVMAAFELIDDEGNYHRYDPSIATHPLSELFDRAVAMAAGTYQAGREALERGFCFHCGGGAHHGHPDFGHGFCVLNDSAIAVRKLQAEGSIHTAWIVDIDVHKGDGTAAIFFGDSTVTTLSIHMASGWPLDGPEIDAHGRQNPSFIPSDIDIPIAEGEEDLYLERLLAGYEELEARAATDRPDVVFVLAGSDPYERDELPSSALMKLSLDQMNRRNRMTYEFLSELDLPQAWLMAGGYGEHAWETYPDVLKHVLRERLP